MQEVFADAGYFIARLNDKDSLHNKAVTVTNALGPVKIVTTQMVLTEVLNHMSNRGEHLRSLAVQLIDALENNPDVEIVEQTDAQFKAALGRYAQRSDKAWSLTDCASFLVMERRNITEALAHDRNFKQAGFVALLRERQGQ